MSLRYKVAKGDPFPRVDYFVTYFFFLSSLVIVQILSISPFHLIWLFLVSMFLGFCSTRHWYYPFFPGPILYAIGKLFGSIVLVGLDYEFISTRSECAIIMQLIYLGILPTGPEPKTISKSQLTLIRFGQPNWAHLSDRVLEAVLRNYGNALLLITKTDMDPKTSLARFSSDNKDMETLVRAHLASQKDLLCDPILRATIVRLLSSPFHPIFRSQVEKLVPIDDSLIKEAKAQEL